LHMTFRTAGLGRENCYDRNVSRLVYSPVPTHCQEMLR
jgi:hypothetical protein